MEPFETTGYWWLPYNEDKKIPGILKFTYEEGLILSLIGTFRSSSLGDLPSYRIILGIKSNGSPVTLYDCLNLGQTLSGINTEKFYASIGYINAHFHRPEEIVFNKAIIEFTNLSHWLQKTGFSKKIAKVPDIPKVEISYDVPERLVAQTPQGKIIVNYDVSHELVFFDSVHLDQTVDIEIEFTGKMSFDRVNKYFLTPLLNLLDLGTDTRNYLVNLYFLSEKVVINYRGHETKEEKPTQIGIKVYCRTDRSTSVLPKKPTNMLFTLADIELEFEQVINKWLNISEKIQDVCSLFFSVLDRYNKEIIQIESDFLKLAQAVETFHANVFPKDEKFLKEFNEKKKSVSDSISDKRLKNWFEKNVDTHGATYKERIQVLFDLTKDIVAPLTIDPDGFAEYVKNTRNYHTHHGGKEKAATTVSELYSLYVPLLFMLRACLMRELGISEEKWKALIKKNNKYICAANQTEKNRIKKSINRCSIKVEEGKAMLVGTNTPVYRIIIWYKQGMTATEIAEDTPFDISKVRAAIDYYNENDENKEQIDNQIKAENAQYERLLQLTKTGGQR